jgi:HJR/Mrr/RecB family endonuclease
MSTKDYIILLTAMSIIACILFILNKKYRNKKGLSEEEIRKIKNKILSMSPREFEVFCSNLLELSGYKAIITCGSNDGGKDIILNRLGRRYYVECKRFKFTLVGRPIAQKLAGALIGDGLPVKNGIIITSSDFTKGCREYCDSVGIKLWDFNVIIEKICSIPVLRRKDLIKY